MTCAYQYQIFLYSLLVLFLTTGCQPGCMTKGSKKITKEDSIEAAVINDVSISAQELDGLFKRARDQFAKTNRPTDANFERQLRGSILRKLMDDEVLRQRAAKEGIKIDRFERVNAFEKYKEKIGGPKRFAAYLERQNLTLEQVEKTVVADLLREKIVEKLGTKIEPTEAEIKDYYLANQRLYASAEMVHARHILLKFSANESKEKENLVIKKAHQILQEAALPNVTFESLVQKYSEGPSVKTGGDLGFFPRGRMVKSFDDAVFLAPIKKAVGPIKTEFGYHIIYVEEKRPPKVASFDEVKERITDTFKRTKRSRQTEEMLTSLRQQVNVTIYDSSLTKEEYINPRMQVAANDRVKP